MKTMRDQFTVLLFTMACSVFAHACLPGYEITRYFGELQHVNDDIYRKIKEDISKNRYQIIEERIGLRHFPLIKKGDAIYLDDKVIATKQDSFWYLGHGYYQLNGELHYMGTSVGGYPSKGRVSTWAEDRGRSKPDNFPPNMMYCPVAAHADILETSEGLHVENLVYDN